MNMSIPLVICAYYDACFYKMELVFVNGKDAWELIKEGISKDNSIAPEFKGAAYDYVQGLMDVVADKGWDNIPDIRMDVMYSGENGLYVV